MPKHPIFVDGDGDVGLISNSFWRCKSSDLSAALNNGVGNGCRCTYSYGDDGGTGNGYGAGYENP